MKNFSTFKSSLFFFLLLKTSDTSDELGDKFPDAEMKNARENGLIQVNLYRKWHKAPIVALEDKLNQESQKSAEKHIKNQTFTARVGEIIFVRYKKTPSPWNITDYVINAVASWYLKICRLDFIMTGDTEVARVLYKHSTTLGIGIARNKKGSMLKIIAQFMPGGNTEKRKTYKEPSCPNMMEICDTELRREIVRGGGRCREQGMGLKSWGDDSSAF